MASLNAVIKPDAHHIIAYLMQMPKNKMHVLCPNKDQAAELMF
jgi:hypothetical protein